MDRADLLHYAMYVMRCEMLRHVTRESCILATRIMGSITNEMGFKSFPLCVSVSAMNEIAWENAQRGLTPPEDDGSFVARIEHSYDEDDDSGTFPGHVVLVVENEHFLDASADQLSRPEQGLTVEPISTRFKEPEQLTSFLDGESFPMLRLPTGGIIQYQAFADDTSYFTSPDWTYCQPGDPLYDYIRDTTLGLVAAVEDLDEPPDVPPLPKGISHGDDPKQEIEQAISSLEELGQPVPDNLRVRERVAGVHTDIERLGLALGDSYKEIVKKQKVGGAMAKTLAEERLSSDGHHVRAAARRGRDFHDAAARAADGERE